MHFVPWIWLINYCIYISSQQEVHKMNALLECCVRKSTHFTSNRRINLEKKNGTRQGVYTKICKEKLILTPVLHET
jgi:hypothetical protein